MYKKPFVLSFAISLVFGGLISQAVHADTKTWINSDGFWVNDSNWSPAGVPSLLDDVMVSPYDGADTVLRFDSFSGAQFANSLAVNSDTANAVSFLQTGGNLIITNGQIIGSTGTGKYALSGGSNVTASLILGQWYGSNGSYDLSGSGSLATNDEYIGYNGSGIFTQSGGAHTVSNELFIGYLGYYGSSGSSYGLSGGSLSARNEYIGYIGTGTFTQSGGTHTVSDLLYLGFEMGGNGGYNLSGGSLSAAREIISGGAIFDGGIGAFTQSGGTHTVGSLTLGYGASMPGSYNLSGGDLSAVSEVIGGSSDSLGSTGTSAFIQSGGTNTVTELLLGSSSSGSYNFSGGTLNVGTIVRGAGISTFNWSAGTLNYGSDLVIGSGGSFGSSLNLNADMALSAHNLIIDTNGVFNHTGGINTISNLLTNNGTYNLSGGTLNVGAIVPGAGTSAFNWSAGTLNYGSDLLIGSTGPLGSDFNLNFGMALSAPYLTIVESSFIHTGGTNTVSGIISIGSLGSIGSYSLYDGSLSAAIEYIDTGYFDQEGGENTASGISLGGYSERGSYVLRDGSLIAGHENIGASPYSTGTFYQFNGTHTVSGNIALGMGESSSGVYYLSGGSLSAENEILGSGYLYGSGYFTQSGGTNTVSGMLILARDRDSYGTYDLNGGTLNVGAIVLGAGHSAFNWSAGTLNYGSDLIIGSGGGPLFGSNPILNAGMALSAPNLTIDTDGIFNHTGGTNTVSTLMTNNGAYNLSGGTLVVDGSMDNSGSLVLAGGSISGSGALVNNATVSGHGTIGGSGGFTNNALITQNGGHIILANTGANANYGNIDLASSFQLRLNGASLNNGGTINLDSANVTGSGTLNNTFGGVISGRGTISSNFSNDGGMVVMVSGTTNITHAFANSGVLQLGGTTASLAGGAITNTGTIEGFGNVGNNITNTGIVRANGGTLALGGASVSNNGGGLMTVSTGSTLLAVSGMTSNAGVINLVGGAFDTNNHALANDGQISGYGTLRTGGLTNNGTMTLTGGTTTVNGNVTNAASGKIEVAHSPAIFTGDVVNNGQFKSTHTTVTFAGTYTENGAYISDPSINNFTNLIIGSSGYLVGGSGDEWHITGSFENHSLQNTLWNTANADLFFDGSGMKNLYVAGADYGLSPLGFTNNFAFESLNLASGAELNILDGNAMPGAAMYVQLLNLGGGVSQLSDIHSDYNIYYNPTLAGNAYLLGSTYTLDGGGVLAPAIPEPEFYAMLLAGLGILGFAARRRNKLCNA